MTRRELIQKLMDAGSMEDEIRVRVLKRNQHYSVETYKVVAIAKVNHYTGHSTTIDVEAKEINESQLYS